MKKIHIILFFTLWVIASSCSTYYVSNKQVMEVQQGMSRQNVERILGKPDYRRFDGNTEEWEFHRVSSVLYGNSIKIIVYFADGRVTSMDTFNGDEILLPPPVLDIMLPDGSGLELLERLKALHKRENVIIISAKDSLEDKVLGLELGADDYLPKPFHLAELNARIKSVIRRNQHDGEITIRQGNVRIEPDKYRVFVDEQELELNRKEYDILLYFINRPGRLVNKSTLAESVWGDHIDQVDNFDFIYAQIKNLRKKLKDAGANIEIKAVYGFGYKMIVE